jgi:UDP-N-acetylglucosamine acyltransferase
MRRIAPTASIDPKAELADDVEIGPGCHIGPEVTIGRGSHLIANVTVIGNTTIGERNKFYPSCVIGAAPQDLKYQGTSTRLNIGNENIFREGVTAHTGTEVGAGVTEIGDHNQFQVGSHLAHDVRVGSHCILSNQVQIAGHVRIEDHVTVSGLVGVQQFVTLGQYCFITGMARCTIDTPPYMIFGFEGSIQGVNIRGLGRWGFDEPSIQQLRELCKKLFPRKNQVAAQFGLRSIYRLMPFKKDERSAQASLARRIRECESNGPLDRHGQYLIDFLKRSIHQGVHGRYLESHRRDQQNPLPSFYAGGVAQ